MLGFAWVRPSSSGSALRPQTCCLRLQSRFFASRIFGAEVVKRCLDLIVSSARVMLVLSELHHDRACRADLHMRGSVMGWIIRAAPQAYALSTGFRSTERLHLHR